MFNGYSRLGLGGIPLQRVTPVILQSLIDAMAADGQFVIDTAKGYGVSEAWLGEAIRHCRDQVFVATKSMARTYDLMKLDIEDSLVKLQVNCIDLYQVHNVRFNHEYELIMSEQGAYRALVEAQQAGKIKHIGITSHSVDFIMSIIDTMPFVSVMIPFNLLEQQAKDLLIKAQELNISTLVMKPLAGGAFDDPLVALRYLFNQPLGDMILVGMADETEYMINRQALYQPISESDLTAIDNYRQTMTQNFCRRCGYCAPCTVNIDIPFQFVLLGYVERYGLKDWAMERYNALKVKADACISCQVCEPRCPYQLPISEKMRQVAAVLK
jgi:uncharacterized protein